MKAIKKYLAMLATRIGLWTLRFATGGIPKITRLRTTAWNHIILTAQGRLRLTLEMKRCKKRFFII